MDNNNSNSDSTVAASAAVAADTAADLGPLLSPFERSCPENDILTSAGAFLSYHCACAILAAGFIIPKGAKLSALLVRATVSAGFALMATWAHLYTCSVDLAAYCAALVPINCAYLLYLLWKHFPVFIPKNQRELFNKVFKPLNFSKKYFKLITRDCSIARYSAAPGQPPFAVEQRTPAADSLGILLSGKLAVKCDDIFLHFVMPFEFVNSIEWKARDSDAPPKTYQVSIDVVTDANVLVLPASALDKTLSDHRDVRFILDCLLGKDITRKLYMMSENVSRASSNQRSKTGHGGATGGGGGGLGSGGGGPPRGLRSFHRTNSVDAVNTGCKGFVRSHDWTSQAAKVGRAGTGGGGGGGGVAGGGAPCEADGHQLAVLNLELDVPPTLPYLPHGVPVHTVDRATMAEAHFIAQQRKYWPVGIL